MIYLTKIVKVLFVISLLLLATACNQEPAEIHYGSDECAHCKMMITDKQFASQIVTTTGKAIKFDAIECMVAYSNTHKADLEGAFNYVSDYNNPGSWLIAQQAIFVQSEVVNSPMGESLLAFPSDDEARKHVNERPGTILEWAEVSQIKM